jgi:site-specific DNA-methyltransferase (adenine-specific)
MSTHAGFSLRGRNPDVLTCIANLSSDEVFTPPEFANRMLDTLAEAWAADHGGTNIWAKKTVKFLDPFTKSGVFLREITSRLTKGLTAEIPDLEERVDHIQTKQVFGIGITHLTGMLARRSVYCSKHANGKHSVAKSFTTESGNIWFERTEHAWADDRCKYCGANQKTFERGEGLETHAYAFIHTDDIKTRIAELFGGDMQFDVIIGNPPYQITGGGGGTNDSPIYHLFPTVGIGGGICYFLWDREHPGLCECVYHRMGATIGPYPRPLDEFDVFVRDKRSVDILHKVVAANERPFEEAETRRSVWRRTSRAISGTWHLKMVRSVSMRTSVQQESAAL